MYKFRYYLAAILWSLLALQQVNAFVLELNVDKTEYVLGEPVVVYASITNDSPISAELPQHLLPEYYDVTYMIGENRFKAWILSEHLEPTKTFVQGEILRQEIKLFCGSKGRWTFPSQGVYNITAKTQGQASNTLTLTVRAPANEQEEQVASLLLDSTDVCYFLLFEAGGHLVDGIQRLQQVVDQYPDSSLAIYANQALGNNLLIDFTNFTTGAYRPSDPASALPYLEAAQVKSASFYDFSHTYFSLYEAYIKLGDAKQAQTILGDLVAITTEYREDFLPFLNDILKTKGLEEAAKLALLARFNPRIVIAKETGHNEVVIRDEKGEIIQRIATGTSGNDINVATADFDDDGEDDIAINVGKQIKFHKLNGNEISTFSINKEGEIAAGDTNGDGLPEILTTSKAANTNSVSIYAYDGTLLKTVNINSLGKNTKLSIATADTNGDGTVEIIAGDLKGDQVAIYSVDGTEINTFTVFQDTNTRRRAVRKPGDNGNACDHKGKGRPKFCDEPEPLPVEEPTPSSEPEPVVTEPTPPSKPEPVVTEPKPVVTEPTPPSEPEPVVTEPVPVVTEPTSPSEPEPVVTEPVPVVTKPTPSNKPEKPKPNKPAKPSKPKKTNGVKVAAGDTNGDGVPEIIVGMASKGSTVEIYNIDGERQHVFATVLNKNGIEIAAGDVNKDGKDDVIVGDAKGTKVLVYDLDGQIGQFQGLDSKNIASIAFGKGAIKIVNPFPPQPPVVDEPTVEIPTDEQSTDTPTDGQPMDTPTDVPATPTDEQPTDTPTDVPTTPTDDGQATTTADDSENSAVTPMIDDVTTTDEEPPVIVEDEQKDEPTGLPALPPPPTTGDISGTHNYGGETLTDATIETGANIAKVNIAGETTNEGRLSNITVSDGATLQGGTISGDLANEGTVKDITFVGRKIEGGEFGGTLNIESDTEIGLGTVENVTLLADTQVKGGIFEGTVVGDADSKALIEAAKFDSEAKLSNIIIGQDCEIEEGVEIGTGVRFTANDLIPEETDLSAALTTDGEIDFSTDVVTDAPNLLKQINALPDMQDNNWQLEQNDGRLEVMVDGTRMRVKPKRVKQAKRNRRAEIIIHGDGTVTVITAKGREILVEVQASE